MEKEIVSTDSSKNFLEKMELCLKQNKFASVLFKADKLEAAEKHFLSALETSSNIKLVYTNLYQNLGNLYAQKKMYDRALDYFQRVIDESPYSEKNEWSKKIDKESEPGMILFSTHLNSREAYVDAHTNLGYTLLGLGRPEEAVPYCKKSLELDPKNKESYINIGNCLRQMGKREETVELTLRQIEKDVGGSRGEVYKIKRLRLEELLEEKREEEETVTIITVKWGTKYDSEYVNKLYRGFLRNTTKPFTFVCFTDDPSGLLPAIRPLLLLENWKGWWGKATIFSASHGFKGLKFFIDLDMIITGNIDRLFGFTGKFALLRTDELYCETLNKNGYNSSIVLWRDDYFDPIYSILKNCYQEMSQYIYRFDYWLEMIVQDAEFIQELYPNVVVDYMAECKDRGLKDDARIVCFPRDPKPHEVTDQAWVQLHWK